MRAAAVFVLACALAGPASAEEVRAQSSWFEKTPGGQTIERLYPKSALHTGQSGGALLSCTAGLDRELECAVMEEMPANSGFGQAAIAVAHDFVLSSEGVEALKGKTMSLPVMFSQQR